MDMAVLWAIKNKVLLVLHTVQRLQVTLDTACRSYLGEHRLPSGLCLPADHGIQF